MTRSDEGSVFQRGGQWFARLRYTDRGGVGREKKRQVPTRAAGWAKISELQNEIADELTDRTTYRQLDAFYRSEYVHEARFRDGKKISGFRQPLATVNLYLDASLVRFGDKPLDAITYRDLADYKTHLLNKATRTGGERSIADVNAHLKRLRRVLNVAVQSGWLTQNPFERGDPLIIDSHGTERTRTLSRDEEARLLASCTGKRKHLASLIKFAIETAMRKGEIQRLVWADVDLAGRVIRVRATNTKTEKPRMVPIFERCQTTLAELRQNVLWGNSPVFGAHDWKRAYTSACTAAGMCECRHIRGDHGPLEKCRKCECPKYQVDAKISTLDDITFHDLRHTGITRMIEEKNLPIAVVMKISGHTQMRTFMRYLNQSTASVYEIATRFDGMRKTG
jgi:integrase